MPSDTAPAPRRRRHIWAYVLGTFVVGIVALVALWDWDWFLPLVDRQASAVVGRKVTAQHLHVQLGRTTVASLEGIRIDSADGYPTDKPFATIDKLTVTADLMAYIR